MDTTPGCRRSQVWYDTIRADGLNEFNSAAACVDSNEPDTTTLDATPLGVGAAFFYLVRPENDRPNGEWNLGTDSDGLPHPAIDCP